jgi:hypothetical protein
MKKLIRIEQRIEKIKNGNVLMKQIFLDASLTPLLIIEGE